MKSTQTILDSFNLRIPVIAAPMFIVSQPQLVKQCCESGIVGTFPALNNRTTEGFDTWCSEMNSHQELHRGNISPYGVNLIVHKTNPRVQPDLEICIKHRVPLIITSLGAVKEVVDAVHSYGGLIFHDVTNAYHAQKPIDAGVDGIICVASGAGGHAGTLNPIALVHEIRHIWEGPLLLGGCLSTGQDIATALQMGADMAYMGTRFINTTDATAPKEYQQMIIESQAKDIVYTAAISGIPGNYMMKSLEAVGITQEMWNESTSTDFGNKLNQENAKAWKDIWSAGQGVTSIEDVLPAAVLVDRLHAEFLSAIKTQRSYLKQYGKSAR